MTSTSSIMHEASAVLDQLLSEVKAKFASSQQQQGVFDAIKAFTAAVDWKEPWLLTVLFTQLALFLSILSLRRNTSYLTSIFLLAMTLVYFSERLNRALGQHWKSFAGQPYFDKHGIFISAILSAPLVADMVIILILYLANLSKMLVQMKRQEIRKKARQRAKVEGSSENKKTS